MKHNGKFSIKMIIYMFPICLTLKIEETGYPKILISTYKMVNIMTQMTTVVKCIKSHVN